MSFEVLKVSHFSLSNALRLFNEYQLSSEPEPKPAKHTREDVTWLCFLLTDG